MTTMRKRSALLVGCNYPDSHYKLFGCHNDVKTMQTLLINRFSMAKKDIKIMTDAPTSSVMPTGANIRKALVDMIHGAKQGDILFFFFSGLGKQVRPCGNEHPAIVSCDFHFIKDDEFRRLVDHLPKDATFTFLADSSHSGGLILNEKEQTIPAQSGPEPGNNWEADHRLKTFPNDVNSTIQASNVGSSDISAYLSEVFGTQVTANFSSANSQSGCPPADNGILLSSCRKIEPSVEVDPNDNQCDAYGSFTNAVEAVLKKNPGQINNKELVTLAGKFLHLKAIGQHPSLFCSDKNADAPFLGYEIGKSV